MYIITDFRKVLKYHDTDFYNFSEVFERRSIVDRRTKVEHFACR